MLKYEVPFRSADALSLKGILMEEVVNICKHCLDIGGNELFCHPIIVKTNPDIPMPFLILIDETP